MIKIFDAHFHLLESTFTAQDYQNKVNVCGGALISCSFQEYDQKILLEGLKQLGPDFVAVTQLPPETSDQEILKLHEAGVRGVRFPLYRGGSADHLVSFGKRIYDLAGWHVELYTDKVHELKKSILQLPKVSIDHLGMSKKGLDDLVSLSEQGVKIKASGFYRVDFDVKEALQRIDPEALMFGTDLPGIRATRTFSNEDLQLIEETFSPEDCEKIFWQNALSFYRKF